MRKNIFVMNALVIIFWMAVNVYMPNLPAYSQSIGADAVTLGIIGGVYGIALIIVRIPLGLMTDNTQKRRRLLLIGSVILVVSCVILVFANNTGMIILGRLLAGASGAWWVTQNATYANYFNEEKQMKAQGMLAASMNWGKLAAALVGGLIAQFFGIQPVFVVALAISFLCIALTLQLKDIPVVKKEKKTLADLLPVLKNADVIKLSLMAALVNMMAFTAPILFTLVAAKELGGSSLDMGLLNVAFFLTAALSSLLVGTRIYRKVGGIRAVAAAFILGFVGCIPALYHINIPAIYLAQIICGLSFGINGAALAGMVNRSVEPQQRGLAIGIFNCVNALGLFVGPVLVGNITSAFSFDAAYWTLAAVEAVAAVLCFVLIPQKYAKA